MSVIGICSARTRSQDAPLYPDCKTERRQCRRRRRRRRRRRNGGGDCVEDIETTSQYHNIRDDYLDRLRRIVGLPCLVFVCVASVVASTTALIVSDQQYLDETIKMKLRRQEIQSKKYNRDNTMRRSWVLDLESESPSGKAGKDGKSSSKSGKSKSDKTSSSWPSWPSWSSSSSSTSPNCSDESAEPPTENPSQAPTILPSIMPSESPTMTASPTTSPVQTPSTVPTITVSSLPSTMPSISPTAKPSTDVTSIPSAMPSISPSKIPTSSPSFLPSYGPIHQPSSLPSKSLLPTAGPSLAASMLPSVFETTEPSKMPSIAPSTMPTLQVSLEPSSFPSNSPTYFPTRIGTDVPSSTPSNVPTIEISIDTRQDLKMSLFGLPNALLDTSEQQYYQLRTATYIEEFYNKDDGTKGILEAIKSEITNVTAALTIESQEYEDDNRVTDGIRMIPINNDDESYLPEFAVANRNRRLNRKNRLLQTSTQVTEPCVGTSSLKITFSLELSYRTSDIYQLDSNAVIFFPFSAVDFRTNYIDNYLKTPQFDGEETLTDSVDASAVFADVVCTSRVVDLADTESPTYRPSTITPSSLNPSVPPSSTPSVSSSSIPSSSPSVSPSYSATSVPSNIPSSLTSVPPSSGEPVTLTPSLQSASSTPSTKLPSTSVSFSPSSISSVSPTNETGESSAPSISTRPSTGEFSTGPTTIPPSLLPVGSTSPTLPNGEQPITVAPSSSVPTVVTNNTSVTPTISNVILPTQLPTTPLINPGRQSGNTMAMFGLTTPLSQAEKDAWNSRTTSYILAYYNDYEGGPGIRSDIYDVEGYLVTNQGQVGRQWISDEAVPEVARSNSNNLMRFNDEWRYWNDEISSDKAFGSNDELYHMVRRSYDESYEANEHIGKEKSEDDDIKQIKTVHKNVGIVPHKGPRKFNPTADNARQLQGCGGANVNLQFSINLKYRNRGATEWTLNEIFNDPFRTWRLRNDYKNNVLKQPGDPIDLFDGLSCVGAIVFPPSTPAARFSNHEKRLDTLPGAMRPTMSTAYLTTEQPANHHAKNDPSTTDKLSKSAGGSKLAGESSSIEMSANDIFIDLRMTNNGMSERKCQGEDIRAMNDKMEEFELSFVYGVESSSQDVYELTDDLENLVLDFIASTVLICASDSDVITVQRSQHMEEEFSYLGVVRVRYPEYGEITSIADCDTLMPSQAKSCAILKSKLLVTSAGAPISEVHHDILMMLMKAFNENKFGESIPNLTTTSYLGPDPESLTLSSSSLVTGMLKEGGTSRTSGFAVSIGCSLLILIVALCVVFRRSSNVADAKHSSRFSRRRHKRIATQEEEEGAAVEERIDAQSIR